MIINGKWMNEPEIIALISQLTAEKEKLEKQVEQTVKRGMWIKGFCISDSLFCSVCGNNHDCSTTYCPNCGADMRGTET